MVRYLSLLIAAAFLTGCGQPPDSAEPAGAATEDSTSESPPAEQAAADAEASRTDEWSDEFERMKSALTLSDDEQAGLQAAFESRQQEYTAWMAEHGADLESYEKKMMAAARSRDLGGVRSAKAKAEPLRNELRALLASHQDAIIGALSAENQTAWAAAGLADRLLELMVPLELSEEQSNQIQANAVTAAQQAAGEPNPSAAGFLNLEKAVERSVLTADQRTAYEAIRKKNPMRSLK